MTSDFKKRFDYFFNQVKSPFEGSVFKEDKLQNGRFFIFEMPGAFFSSSEEFIKALSDFLKVYDNTGYFNLTAVPLLENALTVPNSFNPDILPDLKDGYDVTLRYLPEFYFDSKLNWCIYGSSDLHFFALWCTFPIIEEASLIFLNPRLRDFKIVSDKSAFLQNIAESAARFRREMTVDEYANSLLETNRCIFSDL